MEDCLLTKLSGQISSKEYIPSFGELIINFKKGNYKLTFSLRDSIHVKLENGHFTDESLQQNLGTTSELNIGRNTICILAEEGAYLSIDNKYNIKSFSNYPYPLTKNGDISFDISDIKYIDITSFYDYEYGIYGDIEGCSWNIRGDLCFSDKVYGSIDDIIINSDSLNRIYMGRTSIKDSTNLSRLSNTLTELSLGNNTPGLTLDLSIFRDFTKLSHTLNLTKSQVTGTTDDLANTLLNGELRINSEVVGDLSKLPKNLKFFSARGKGTFTWETERSPESVAFCVEEVNLGNYVDAFLINMDKCVVSNYYPKFMSVLGSRTSASDAAVASLKSKGYIISVNSIRL